MDAYLYEAVVQRLVGEGVVKVLGIGRVDCEGEGVAEVAAALDVIGGDVWLDGSRFFLHVRLKAVRKADFSEDGVHFRIVVPRLAQYVHYVASRGSCLAVPADHGGGNLHSALDALGLYFFCVYEDVIGHCAGLHKHPGLESGNVEDAHERYL